MSARELQAHAYREWSSSTKLQYHYHTFDYYWSERYARVYRLPARVGFTPFPRTVESRVNPSVLATAS